MLLDACDSCKQIHEHNELRDELLDEQQVSTNRWLVLSQKLVTKNCRDISIMLSKQRHFDNAKQTAKRIQCHARSYLIKTGSLSFLHACPFPFLGSRVCPKQNSMGVPKPRAHGRTSRLRVTTPMTDERNSHMRAPSAGASSPGMIFCCGSPLGRATQATRPFVGSEDASTECARKLRDRSLDPRTRLQNARPLVRGFLL